MEYILRALWGATGVRNWIVAGIIYYYYDDILCYKIGRCMFPIRRNLHGLYIYTVYSVQVH